MKRKQFLRHCPAYFVILLLGGFLILKIFSGSNEYKENDTSESKTEPNYAVKSPEIPENLNFAGEDVPLQYFDVNESLDRELITNSYWHSSTIQILKKTERFFPLIDSVLKAKNVPQDFKYLCVIESNLKNVTSPAGAKGYWQFMRATGKEYGLEINSYVDERLNLLKSTQAACDYLKDAKEQFGSWTLAAASYNMGKAGLKRRLKEQKVDNYYDIYLNPETARYVYRILAMKIIMPQHKKYGFQIKQDEKYYPIKTKTLKVDTAINDLIDFAFKNNTNYKILKELNPWLTNKYLFNDSQKEYLIRIPRDDERKSKPAVENKF